jgi:glycosyltransferase involved in cell wall biosynthesis
MSEFTSWKILLILEASGGGVGRHVIDLARELDQRGHTVHLIYSGLRMEEGFNSDLETLGRVNTCRIDMHRAPHLKDLAAVLQVHKYIDSFGPFDVIHGHSSKGGAVARLAAIGLPGFRIYTPHAFRTLDPLLRPLSRWLYRGFERILSFLSNGIILVSVEEKNHATTLGLTPKKLYVVPNGIDPGVNSSRDEARRQLNLESDKLYIGFVGRLVHQKNPASLIEAFAGLAGRFELARLVLLGDGPLSSELHSLATHLGVAEQVIWMTDPAGPTVMPALDVFVMPSRYEAFPYVLLEAAAARLPIVATPVGGTSAVLQDKVNGFLVPPDHPDMLTQALYQLLENPVLRQKMGQASEIVARRYTIAAMTDKTLNVYKTVINGGSNPAPLLRSRYRGKHGT